MHINLEVRYLSYAGRVLQRGSFKVIDSVEQTALSFLREIERTKVVLKVEKVVCNGDTDITKEVLELWNKPLDDV